MGKRLFLIGLVLAVAIIAAGPWCPPKRAEATFLPMVRIAVDAMGGDHAPGAVVEGALLAAKELGVEIFLVGQQDAVERELRLHSVSGSAIRTVPASQVVAMGESPGATLKKKDSSMMVAFQLIKRGEVQAVVSAGNSGAMMATGMFVLGNLFLVDRPAIMVVVPSLRKGTVIIDAGANVECKPHQLVQFGLMGSLYAEKVLAIPSPRVGVLSNGEEEGKGNELTRAASEQLRSTPLNYIGYVEGRDISSGEVDVVVCDGFTGNVALKTMEGVASFMLEVQKEAFRENTRTRLTYLLSRGVLHRAFSRLDYAEYGGAPLLGLDGVAIVAHGGSGPKAIKNAVRVAKETVSHDVNRHIIEALEGLGEAQKGESFPRGVWRHIKSKIEKITDKPAPEGEGRETKSGGKG